VRELSEEIVAFCDDDSWLEPDALARAGQAFGRHSRLGLAAARVMVQPGDRLDPVSAEMAQAELGLVDGLDAPRVLGFLACGAVVRRSAFLDSGGFNARYGGGGEEQLLAIDMSARGWDLAYLDDVVAHHEPAQDGRPGRRHRQLHNDLWTAWLRRPLRSALRRSARLLADAEPLTAARGLAAAAAGAPWLVRSRRRVPDELAAELERLG
jgi:cellulose synthase/poly-beta-1,6-N-acetylglucosamine synthase-like glycosyltransferase